MTGVHADLRQILQIFRFAKSFSTGARSLLSSRSASLWGVGQALASRCFAPREDHRLIVGVVVQPDEPKVGQGPEPALAQLGAQPVVPGGGDLRGDPGRACEI
ncbi:hypothetical protein [Streptomyces sp. 7N604]|uniref:hypothetical protein n=1 Tax=Streptomyces sp. 7N604 TaxID=3457415 RepID=UPI003FD64067